MTEQEFDYLKRKTDEINVSIEHLEAATNQLSSAQWVQIRKIKRINAGLLAVSAVLFLLSLATLYQIHSVAEIQRVGTVLGQKTSIEQQARRELVFCPILAALLSQHDMHSPQALADPLEYERGFEGLEVGAKHLGCQKSTRGKP